MITRCCAGVKSELSSAFATSRSTILAISFSGTVRKHKDIKVSFIRLSLVSTAKFLLPAQRRSQISHASRRTEGATDRPSRRRPPRRGDRARRDERVQQRCVVCVPALADHERELRKPDLQALAQPIRLAARGLCLLLGLLRRALVLALAVEVVAPAAAAVAAARPPRMPPPSSSRTSIRPRARAVQKARAPCAPRPRPPSRARG